VTTQPSVHPKLPIILAVAIVAHALAALFYAQWVGDESTRTLIYFGSKVVVNAIPLVWIFGVERRRPVFRRPGRRSIVAGLVSGLVICGVIVAVYFLGFEGRIGRDALEAKAGAYGALNHFYLFAAFLCVGNSGMEEYYWRWFVFGGLRRMMRFGPAVVVSALGFTLHHIVVLYAYFPDLGLVVFLNVGVFAGGCIWAILYEKFGSIVGPWISHFFADVGIMVAAWFLLFGA
jgi:CAAX protease family protein